MIVIVVVGMVALSVGEWRSFGKILSLEKGQVEVRSNEPLLYANKQIYCFLCSLIYDDDDIRAMIYVSFLGCALGCAAGWRWW